ncbi:hypothetical protein Cyrtocomes_00786 [Candidatus Cyrtobacter comes]|uniref:Uncharacterized protein n=1 Tax=Candidatus Cyrtobacter comes TaxID=675776 RepID=A0ABU5L8G2_9RICK|nr:hypothetical protein [Candidatus Cyrtobacter comes]MDZ5762406.1 hypothetical protein [Candidatus Cyrtobacter comes]
MKGFTSRYYKNSEMKFPYVGMGTITKELFVKSSVEDDSGNYKDLINRSYQSPISEYFKVMGDAINDVDEFCAALRTLIEKDPLIHVVNQVIAMVNELADSQNTETKQGAQKFRQFIKDNCDITLKEKLNEVGAILGHFNDMKILSELFGYKIILDDNMKTYEVNNKLDSNYKKLLGIVQKHIEDQENCNLEGVRKICLGIHYTLVRYQLSGNISDNRYNTCTFAQMREIFSTLQENVKAELGSMPEHMNDLRTALTNISDVLEEEGKKIRFAPRSAKFGKDYGFLDIVVSNIVDFFESLGTKIANTVEFSGECLNSILRIIKAIFEFIVNLIGLGRESGQSL